MSLLDDLLNDTAKPETFNTITTPAPAVTPPTQAELDTAKAGGSRGWSADGAARAARDAAIAAKAGIVLPPPVYALGSLLNEYGVERAGQLRREWEELPPVPTAMKDLRAEIKAEDRRDFNVDMRALLMNKNGRLVHPDFKGFGDVVHCEADALGRLSMQLRDALGLTGDLGIVTLNSTPALAGTAAVVFNNAANALGMLEMDRKPDSKGKVKPIKRVRLRTRLSRRPDAEGRQARQLFAVVSEKYAECDVDRVADSISRMENADKLHASVHYHRRGASFDLLTHTTIAPEKQVAGEVFRAGIRVTTDDTGRGAVRVRAIIERNRCLNVIIVALGQSDEWVIRHMGDPSEIAAELDRALAAAMEVIAEFVKAWDTSAAKSITEDLEASKREDRVTLDNLLEDYSKASAGKKRDLVSELLDGTFRGLLAEEKLVSATKIEDVLPHLVNAYWDPRNESGARSLTDITPAAVANGLTLWAQSLPPSSADEVERVAGKIVSGQTHLTWASAPKSAAA